MTPDMQSFALEAQGRAISVNVAHRQGSEGLILLLHGLGCSHRSWLGAWRNPTLCDYGLLAPDFAGFGLSDKPDSFDYELSAQAALIAQLLEHYRTAPLHILAHSMGGAVALLLPDSVLARTKSLVSIEGNLISEDCDMFSRKIIRKDFETFRERYLPRLKRNLNELGPEHADMESADPLAIYRSAQSLVRESETGRLLQRFQERDGARAYIYGAENAEMTVLKHLDARLCHRIEGCGHFPMNDVPNAFYALISDLITR